MKKIMMALAALTAPLSAVEKIEDQTRSLMPIVAYINGSSSIPVLDSSLEDDVDTARNFWDENNVLKSIFDETEYSFQLVEQHLAEYESMNNKGEEWVGEISYNLFTSLRSSLNEIANLCAFLKISGITINDQMARTNAHIKKYQAINQEYNSKVTGISSLLADHPQEKLAQLKNSPPRKYNQDALGKRAEQGTTGLIIAIIKKDLGLPRTEEEKNKCWNVMKDCAILRSSSTVIF